MTWPVRRVAAAGKRAYPENQVRHRSPFATLASMLIDHVPLLALRVRTSDLELRLPNEEELAELADVAVAGFARPGERPFFITWGDGTPKGRGLAVLRWHWEALAGWKPTSWTLGLAAFHEGRPIGMQSMHADDFGVLREVSSWSWLGLPYQGRGLGTQMRAAVLHLAFDGLGCENAVSASFVDNHASRAVSRRLGYAEDGLSRDSDGETALVSQRYRLTRERWAGVERPEVTVEGLDGCREWFGV